MPACNRVASFSRQLTRTTGWLLAGPSIDRSQCGRTCRSAPIYERRLLPRAGPIQDEACKTDTYSEPALCAANGVRSDPVSYAEDLLDAGLRPTNIVNRSGSIDSRNYDVYRSFKLNFPASVRPGSQVSRESAACPSVWQQMDALHAKMFGLNDATSRSVPPTLKAAVDAMSSDRSGASG